MEIKMGMSVYFRGEYDVEAGTVIGFTHNGDVVLNCLGVETYVDPCMLAEDEADAP